MTHTLGAQVKAKGGVEPGVVLASWQTHLDGLTAALGRKFKAAGSKGRFEVNRWAISSRPVQRNRSSDRSRAQLRDQRGGPQHGRDSGIVLRALTSL
jgi:hypothetical protein